MTTATMTFPKTLDLGETITFGGEYGHQIKRVESDYDGEMVRMYELAEWDGDEWSFIAEYRTLREAVRAGYGMLNGYLAQVVHEASTPIDGYNDTVLGDRKLFHRVCRLGESGKPEAEAELREILAKVKAALAA